MQQETHEVDFEPAQNIEAEKNEFGPFQGGAQTSGTKKYTIQLEVKEQHGRCYVGWDFPLPITPWRKQTFPGVWVALYEGEAGETEPVWRRLIHQASGAYDTSRGFGSGLSAALIQMAYDRKNWILVNTPLT